MNDGAILLNPDPLEDFVNELRTVGAWCDLKGDYKIQHYFMAGKRRGEIAISLCGEFVRTFDKITRTSPRKKCLVCDLFLDGRRERIQAIQGQPRSKQAQAVIDRAYRQMRIF